MTLTPKTLQIYLPEGEPRGVRIAEVRNRTMQAIAIPRSKIETITQWSELKNVGVYFLFGESEETGKPLVYIGEAEDCCCRIKEHNCQKDFWQTVIAVTSKTKSLNKAHIKFLESYCIAQCKEAGRYQLENGNHPTSPTLQAPEQADLLDNFQDMALLLSALGHPLFESLRQTQSAQDVLYCRSKDAEAQGVYGEDGLTVFAGSKVRKELAPSAGEGLCAKRNELIAEELLVDTGTHYVFKEDHSFKSPSAAAGMVLGMRVNGWDAWKDKDGRTLDALKRKL